jgi:hypothetical protein
VDFGFYGGCSSTEGSIYERSDNTLRMKGTGKKKKSREITVDLSEGRSFYEVEEKGAWVFQAFVDSLRVGNISSMFVGY